MAREVTIGGDGTLFIGEDKILRLEVLDEADAPVNISGWAITFDVRRLQATSILALSATVTGTYAASRSANTQRAVVTLTDTHMGLFSAQVYRHSWKRTTDGFETVLAYGPFLPERTTQT